MSPHLGVQVRHPDQRSGCGPPGDDDLHPLRSVTQRLHHILNIEQPQIEDRIQLVEHHNRIKGACDGSFGDHPAALGLVTVKTGGFFGGEVIASTRAEMVDEMGKTLLKCLDRGVFVVGPSWTFEKAE